MMKFIDSKILLLIAILFSFQNVGFSQEAVDSLADTIIIFSITNAISLEKILEKDI